MEEALRQDITEFLMEVVNHETKRSKDIWIADIRIWFGLRDGEYEKELGEIYELVLQRNGLMKLVND